MIKYSQHKKVLGVKIDQKLNFNAHIKEILKKAGQKLGALSGITPYLDIPKKCIILLIPFTSVSIQLLSFSVDVP